MRLSTPVASIVDDGAGVVVTTRAGEEVRARAAVVALPINTLSDVSISPALPTPVRTLIEERHSVRCAKIWAKVKGEIEPFYAFAPVGRNPINLAMAEYYQDGETLVVCFGADGEAITAGDRDKVQEALRTFLPGIEVLETYGHDWVADEFSQGTWAMHRPGRLTTSVPAMRELHGRLQFAGGDIGTQFAGWIEGAIETGASAACRVGAALSDGTF